MCPRRPNLLRHTLTCAATPNLHSKPITTQMNNMPLDLAQSFSQV